MRVIAVAVGLAILAASPLGSQSLLTPLLDLGVASPTKTPVPQILRIAAPAGVPIAAVVTLQIEDPDASREGGPAEVLVRSRRDEWLPLVDSMPVGLLVTDGTSNEESHAIYIQISPSFTSRPGHRRGKIAVIANGISLGETRVMWIVEPALLLTPDPRSFDSPEVDPTRPGEYVYQPRLYRVKANVGWALEVRMGAALMRDGAVQPLPGDFLFARGFDGSFHSLRSGGEAVVVAVGDPTGEEGASVELRLSARTSGTEEGGSYDGALDVALVRRAAIE